MVKYHFVHGILFTVSNYTNFTMIGLKCADLDFFYRNHLK